MGAIQGMRVMLDDPTDLLPVEVHAEGMGIPGVHKGDAVLCPFLHPGIAECPEESGWAGVDDERPGRLSPEGRHPGHGREGRVPGEGPDLPVSLLQEIPHDPEPVEAVALRRGEAMVLHGEGMVNRVWYPEGAEGHPDFSLHVIGGADEGCIRGLAGDELDAKGPYLLEVVMDGEGRGLCRKNGEPFPEMLGNGLDRVPASHGVPVQENGLAPRTRFADPLRNDGRRRREDHLHAVLDGAARVVDEDVLGPPPDVDGEEGHAGLREGVLLHAVMEPGSGWYSRNCFRQTVRSLVNAK